jgi:uncharacterized protein DUF6950
MLWIASAATMRMQEVLEAHRRDRYEYGACVALAAECVDAMTGSHFRQDVEPLIAAAKERPIALEELQALVTERLGEPIEMTRAAPGDVVLLNFPPPSGPALGVCVGNLIACPIAPEGIGYLRRRSGLCAWRVSA